MHTLFSLVAPCLIEIGHARVYTVNIRNNPVRVYMLYKHATRVPTSQKDTLQACPFQKYTSGASVLLIIKTNEVSFYNDV